MHTLGAAINVAITCELHVQQRRELHGDVLDNRKRAYCHVAESKDPNKKQGCYSCGESGHYVRSCRRRSPYCNYCRLEGHIYNSCMARRQPNYSSNINHPSNTGYFPNQNRLRIANYSQNQAPASDPHFLNCNAVRHTGAMANPRNPNPPASQPAPLSLPPVPPEVNSPLVVFESNDLASNMPRFLIDTGSELNIIKRGLLKDTTPIYKDNLYRLAGISEGLVLTDGYIKIKLDGVHCRLNIVSDDFTIKVDGILRVEFLKEQKAILSFGDDVPLYGDAHSSVPFSNQNAHYLPARTKSLIQISIQNSNRSTGYTPKINAGPGVLIGECLVTNKNGKTNLFAINTTSEDMNIIIPPIKLEGYDCTLKPVRVIRTTDRSETKAELQLRINKILELLDLKDLDQEEGDSIIKLVSEYPCQFHLPNDKLSKTFVITHKIPTIDNIPINVKQYRYPSHLRDMVQKQVQELIDNDIIEESESPYNSPL